MSCQGQIPEIMKRSFFIFLIVWLLSAVPLWAGAPVDIDEDVGRESTPKSSTLQIPDEELAKMLVGTWRFWGYSKSEDTGGELDVSSFNEGVSVIKENHEMVSSLRTDLYMYGEEDDDSSGVAYGWSLWFDGHIDFSWKVENGQFITDRKEEVLTGLDAISDRALNHELMVEARASVPTESVFKIIKITDSYFKLREDFFSDSGEKVMEFWMVAWRVEIVGEDLNYVTLPRTAVEDFLEYKEGADSPYQAKFIARIAESYWYELYTQEEIDKFFELEEDESSHSAYSFILSRHDLGWLIKIFSIDEAPADETLVWLKEPRNGKRIVPVGEILDQQEEVE